MRIAPMYEPDRPWVPTRGSRVWYKPIGFRPRKAVVLRVRKRVLIRVDGECNPRWVNLGNINFVTLEVSVGEGP